MKIIKKLSCFIDEEIGDAEKYARLALEYKDEDPALAQTFYTLSIDEMKHMTMLHESVVKLISQVQEEDDPRIEGMRMAYEVLHEKAIDDATKVRVMQNMFRE